MERINQAIYDLIMKVGPVGVLLGIIILVGTFIPVIGPLIVILAIVALVFVLYRYFTTL